MSSSIGIMGQLVALILATIVAPVAAQQDQPGTAASPGTQPDPSQRLPRIETHAAPGFRLYRAGYRLAGKGLLVTVQLCRILAGPLRVPSAFVSSGRIPQARQLRAAKPISLGSGCASAIIAPLPRSIWQTRQTMVSSLKSAPYRATLPVPDSRWALTGMGKLALSANVENETYLNLGWFARFIARQFVGQVPTQLSKIPR